MKLPEYTAIAISQKNIIGGSTKPCILEVEDDEGKSQGFYVVKIFENESENYNPTLNEAVTWSLSKEFEFKMPSAALIWVEDLFLQQLGKVNNESGYYFGTQLLTETNQINLGQLDLYELENIFAFDLFVHNTDRRDNNPNLLMIADDFYLIDHEKTFANIETEDENTHEECCRFIAQNSLNSHICYHKLKRNKKINFDTFAYLLENCNLHNCQKIIQQLINAHIHTGKADYILSHLQRIKQNQSQFINFLKQLLI